MRCGGCSSSLETAWVFCPTCGKRSVQNLTTFVEQLRMQHPEVGDDACESLAPRDDGEGAE